MPLTCYIAANQVLDAHFLCKSHGRIRHLEKCEDGVFDWNVDRGGENGLEYAGSLILKGDELIFNVLSPELRDAGKVMLRSACGISICHLYDSTQNVPGDDDEID